MSGSSTCMLTANSPTTEPCPEHLLRPQLRPQLRRLGRTRRRTEVAARAHHCLPLPGSGQEKRAQATPLAREPEQQQPWATRRTCACRQPRQRRMGWCCRPLVPRAGGWLSCNRRTGPPCPVCLFPADHPCPLPSRKPQPGCPRRRRVPGLLGLIGRCGQVVKQKITS